MTKRTRNYATVVYPESALEGWQDILAEQCIPAFVSPLHDMDTTRQGELKKAHWHVMLMFDGLKTQAQAREVFEKIGGVGCEIIQSVRGYARYLCHLDNKDRVQYDPNDVKEFAGADYKSIISMTKDKYKAIGEIIDYCKKNDVVSFAELLEYTRQNNFEWFKIACDNVFVLKEYLKSRTWTQNTKKTLDK